MKKIFVGILFLFLSPAIFAADQVVKPDSGFWQNRKEEVMSPWTTSAKPWLVYGTYATLILAFPLEDAIVDPTQAETVEDKPLGKFSPIGDYAGQLYPNVIYGLGMGAHYLITENNSSYENQITMYVASAYAVAATSLLKVIVREPRPNNKKDRHSFPSGHTTSAFAFSSVVIAQHGMWLWGAAATTLATLTAYSRINDNAHYLHDVVGGFTIGTAFGFGIADLYNKRNSKKAANFEDGQWHVLPTIRPDESGLIALRSF